MTNPFHPLVLVGVIHNIVWLFDGEALALGKAVELGKCSRCHQTGHYARTCNNKRGDS